MVGSFWGSLGGNMRKYVILSVLLLIFLTGCTSANSEIVLSEMALEEPQPAALSDSSAEISEECVIEEDIPGTVVVYVCGAVLNPGVYELPDGSRMGDAVEAAGGFSEDAEVTYVNLAARVTDGVKLLIPTVSEIAGDSGALKVESFEPEGSPDSASGGSGTSLVNINTATKAELTTLPGIGEGIAGKIIKYREENGSFSRIEDVMKVSGIKDKLFAKIKDHITV
jgi:competence protein ComEA